MENVIRNQLELDEGDPFSEILTNKSKNNIKSLNFFKNVKTQVLDGEDFNSKIINIEVEEKPTGEIQAGAGAGTEGGTFYFGIKENNYLGKGLSVDANATISTERFKGILSVTNPNYKNTNKSTFFNLQAIEIDQLKDYGYKTNKTGFELGTNFEYFEDFRLGLSSSTFVEKIETASNASVRQKAQKGNYLDTFVRFNFDLDKRNQKFKTSDGYRSNYNINIPVVSDTNTLTNSYNYKIYSELYENNISSFSLLLKSATSITGDDVKLTERLSIPSNRLRGFERGKVGPRDGADYIGGNYLSAINFQSTIPALFNNSQNLDAVIFLDAANVWGVDYDSSLDDSSQIRSSIGIGIDWLTAVGPLNFSLTEVISKNDTDIEESFRFNLGTTF
jgi:outer membrane protein insertion porin family